MRIRRHLSRAPLGSEYVSLAQLAIGDTLVIDHQVWTLTEINERPADLLTEKYTHVLVVEPISGGEPTHYGVSQWTTLHRFPDPEHYPVCRTCGGPIPCREQIIEHHVQVAAERARRYEIPGVCPGCEEPVGTRQLRQTWPDNLVVPNGLPVTFHLRKKCIDEAMDYDRRWIKAGRASQLGNVSGGDRA